jgi:hypothetical protein
MKRKVGIKQNPEFRIQKKRKTKSVKAVSALAFWILDSDS